MEVREGTREPGTAFLVAADCTGLEGIVSKKANMPYRSGPLCDWFKVKCHELAGAAVRVPLKDVMICGSGVGALQTMPRPFKVCFRSLVVIPGMRTGRF